MLDKWYGITYPVPVFLQREWFWNLWKKYMCPRGWHLLDEVMSIDDHSLFCDACELNITITSSEK